MILSEDTDMYNNSGYTYIDFSTRGLPYMGDSEQRF